MSDTAYQVNEVAAPQTPGLSGACEKAIQQWTPSGADLINMAHICHEANRVICIVNGDDSQPAWADAPDWQRESACAGVQYHLAHPHAQDRDSHDQWMERKLREGWRYGEVKDATQKTHPCLLPFHALPENEKIKDSVFKAIVNGYVKSKRGW